MSTCHDCGRTINAGDSSYETINGYTICHHCRENDYTICDGCGELVYDDDINYDGNGNSYCEDCYEDHRRGLILEYHDFEEDDIEFFGDTHNGSVPYLGVELEIDKGNCNNNTAECIKSIMPTNFIHFEYDGSLSTGFENITQPATLEYHESLKETYKKMFKTSLKNGYRSHNTRTCGLHVHFNRSFFNDNEDLYVTRLLFLIEKFWDELSKFSRRNIDNINSWAKKYEDKPEDVVKKSKRYSLNRYYALNLTNCNTIEFRIFRGTLRYETFIATLQLVNILVCKSKTITENELQSIKWTELLETDELKSYWETVKDRVVS